ncbi:MAG: riboflavin biosynthesis protein RibF [Spirochaetes bacterium GWD1_27_9]|nr:MAG: riboflavin biosynthesis protein RibF [Spirochaetes bacterium GWB1_27_13]OHD20234.1 MAG: riboflavin biosynthesis protein RibF [Spirochaetes bacterium GWC1_27_15]OHD42579.1 MAG: riboflavin biosynthesis protein RibF [Spirochaetes bacterium GWD1_27_9]
MKVYNTIFERHDIKKEGIISIGFFESFHLGHQKILNELLRISKEEKFENYVLTYKNLPCKNPDKKTVLDLNTRIEFIKSLGIKNLILCDYTPEFSSLLPDQFINLLKINFDIDDFVIGKDFNFGKDKAGNVNNLIKSNSNYSIIEPLYIDNEKVSTSLIKELIFAGEVEKANKFMGRNFFIEGIVNKGQQIGRTIGFPTMNIHNNDVIFPKAGTYISKTNIKEKEYFSMTYVDDKVVETNLFGYNEFHYNFKIKVDFLKKIRDNATFENIQELKKQIERDLQTTKQYFGI